MKALHFDGMGIAEIIAWCLKDSQYGKPPERGWEDNWGDAVYKVICSTDYPKWRELTGSTFRHVALEKLSDMVATVGRSIIIDGEHDCDDNAVPYESDGALGHGFECGICGKFLQAG